MEPTLKYLCHSCGTICAIERINKMNDAPTMYCPACGEPALGPTKTSFEAFFADCFRPYGMRLTNLLAVDWAANRHQEREFWPALIDYIRWRVDLEEDTGCPCCSLSQAG